MEMSLTAERHRFDAIDQEQLAAQVVAIMDAHFQRPSADEKLKILLVAQDQITAARDPSRDHVEAYAR